MNPHLDTVDWPDQRIHDVETAHAEALLDDVSRAWGCELCGSTTADLVRPGDPDPRAPEWMCANWTACLERCKELADADD